MRVKKTPPLTNEQFNEAMQMGKEKKKYAWNEKFISSYYYEVETGRIVGQYSKISLSDEVFHAEVNGDSLGQYISEKCARNAIEKQIEKNEQDNENAKKFVRF